MDSKRRAFCSPLFCLDNWRTQVRTASGSDRVSLCLCALAASAQTSYSESAEYKPRSIATPTPKNERKKKSDQEDKTAMVPVSNVAGDKIVTRDITITIPVRVVDRSGSPVGGLKKEEVSVFVDGTEVPVVGFEQDKEPVTMVLVWDSSPSEQLKFKTMKEQASKLVGELPSDMKVMVVDSNSKFNVRSQPTPDREVSRKSISKVSPLSKCGQPYRSHTSFNYSSGIMIRALVFA